MDTLLTHLGRWKPFSALVVGDLMLDEQVYGDAERLSADAPVPVLHVRRAERNAGGAGSLAMDLVAMRARVVSVGVVGDDAEGGVLRGALERAGIETHAVVTDSNRPTTVKRNLIGLAQQRHPQKMFRVDYESREPVSGTIVEAMLASVRNELDRVDIVCIEDYAKGVCGGAMCGQIIQMAAERGVPVLVDPASISDYSRYRGATAMTPNRTEAQRATGMATSDGGEIETNSRVSGHLLESLGCEAVVLTLDRHGALLHERGRDAVAVPTVARQVYDVTGAGDMFLAGLAAGRANGMSWLGATRLANAAAGMEVEVFGVQPIAIEDIRHRLLLEAATARGKLRTREELAEEIGARRARGERIVFTNGCFDVVHTGHIHLIRSAARLGDFLVVGLNDDESVRRLKGPSRPINTEDDRAGVIAALEGVGAVVLFHEETPRELISMLRPHVLVKGGDYGRDTIVGADEVESWGGRVEIVPLVEGRSTTGTIGRMRGA
ncbi:MAG: D-glycero-beta-D-manno-heptose 1-phosphate adenylyltransferase [Phycisphaeraceae bacterium]|nr:D-glycero-beta-D-manno-heptose 1-phosphate adenylyltransferase [Phycisphaeraceae bacterium]